MISVKVLSVASEVYPLIKTGGLADVVGALPAAVAREGAEMRVLSPGYPAVMKALEAGEEVWRYVDLFGGPARVLAGTAKGLALFVIDAPHLFERPGNPYLDAEGKDWGDNHLRFAALGRVGADLGKGVIAAFVPDIVHAHDWQAALAPVYLHYEAERRPGTVITIHNLAFQGSFPAEVFPMLGLPGHAMTIDGVEYFGGVGFLKGALRLADRISTVSPTYAREIMTSAWGMALDGLLRLRARDVVGILNGIDEDVWSPQTDPLIVRTYNALRLNTRQVNKTALLHRFALSPGNDAPLFGVVSRLSNQKGLDLLLECIGEIVGQGGKLAILGAGERTLEAGFAAAARTHAGSVACIFGYDEGVSHLMQAGADFLLVPSRFEPCGLTQLYALRYGATPIVARVGGLADTVIDANAAALAAGVATGIQFTPPDAAELIIALRRAFALYADPAALKRLRLNGMRADVSWRGPAKLYAALYRELKPEAR